MRFFDQSARGIPGADCHESQAGRVVSIYRYLPDLAAGLPHSPGRGRRKTDFQGFHLVLNTHETVPGDAHVRRAGANPVNHPLQVEDKIVSLSATAPRACVRIALGRNQNR